MADEKNQAQVALEVLGIACGIYRHYKGGIYVVYSKSVDEASLKTLIHYYSLEKRTRWTRTMENFMERIQKAEGVYGPRFEYMGPATIDQRLRALGDDELFEGVHALSRAQQFLKSVTFL